ncbi:MAG: prepilin peptidase [Anaeromyxobacter sp.]
MELLPAPFLFGWVALAGATFGSFLNVVIARVPLGQSVVSPRSRCPRCGTPIAWYDNLPIVSWALLRARCRACRAPISVRYPLVEAAGAAAAAGALARHGPTGAAAAELALVLLLLALALIDLDTWLLPYPLTLPLIAAGLLASWAGLAPAGGWRPALLGAAAGFGAFAAVSWLGAKLARKEALGFGDVWLLSGLGAWFGALALLPIVMLASIQGSVVGIALILLGRAQKGEEGGGEAQPDGWVPPRNAVPFGPFLVLGALEWLYAADVLASWVPALGLFK